MANQDPSNVNDDDLLADAIPIEQIEEDEPEIIELEPEPVAEAETIELAEGGSTAKAQIRTFESAKKKVDAWRRAVNTTGTGATHVRTFVSKLRMDAIEHLDESVNQWLDEHEKYEVKFVTVTVGELTGKIKEPALFMSVWV